MLSITHALLGTTDTYTFGLLGHIVTSVEKFLTRLQACGAGGRGGKYTTLLQSRQSANATF